MEFIDLYQISAKKFLFSLHQCYSRPNCGLTESQLPFWPLNHSTWDAMIASWVRLSQDVPFIHAFHPKIKRCSSGTDESVL